MKIIDTRGELCPKPIIITKRELPNIHGDEIFEIWTDNLTALENLKRFLNDNGFRAEDSSEKDYYKIHAQREAVKPSVENVNNYCPTTSNKGYAVVFKSDKMGIGNDELGSILMKGFVNALKEKEQKPAFLIFYNQGVKLTLAESGVIDGLKLMENAGVQIVVCGTCADFFHIKERIAVGTISNMYSILELLTQGYELIYP